MHFRLIIDSFETGIIQSVKAKGPTMKRCLRDYCFIPLLAFFFSLSQVYGQTFDYGKTYINVTKGVNGGTVEPGDTLEIRTTFVVRSSFYDSCAFYDTIRAGTSYIRGSLKILTNEGKQYKAFNDTFPAILAPPPVIPADCGWITVAGPNTFIRMNLGYTPGDAPATPFVRGRIRNTHKPSFFLNTCIMIAAYRVRVTAALGSTINTGGGAISYKAGGLPAATPPSIINFDNNLVAVYTNYGTCPNSVGANSLGTEFNGTFGSGPTRNRGTSANVPPGYTYNIFTPNQPNDYFYGVANNTSTNGAYTTSNAWAKPDPDPDGAGPLMTHRVFQVWDIIGDHTGAASPTLGNPAADTVANKNAGYMLVINSSYKTDSAFKHTVSGLCPNTYYELSFWVRNICSKCGCDSNGKGASNAAGPPFYIPTAPGDSSGVYPNMTFGIDGKDYYSTGNILYTGRWVKKGFTYLTGPAQTSLTMSIRNNAPGGGGNDWALDDIAVATCTPNLAMLPSPTANVCIGNQVDVWCRVRCFFPNYIYWTWEKSIDNGVTWTPTGASGVGSPVMVSGNWEYTANYPSFIADSSSHLNRYRIRIASTPGNLSDPNCSFLAATQIVVWVNNCSVVLPTIFKAFTGQPQSGYARLQWDVENETSNVVYEVERSDDMTTFYKVGTVSASSSGNGSASYVLNDPSTLGEQTYYRIKMTNGTANKYSKIVLLSSGKLEYAIKSLINPFKDVLSFEMIAPENGTARITLIDAYGRVVRQSIETYSQGLNQMKLLNVSALANGAYLLRIDAGEKTFTRSVIRTN